MHPVMILTEIAFAVMKHNPPPYKDDCVSHVLIEVTNYFVIATAHSATVCNGQS